MNFKFRNDNLLILLALTCPLLWATTAQAQILHVSEHVTSGDGSGDSWPNAISSFADALSMASTDPNITLIKVGQGEYLPPLNATDSRDSTFLLIEGVLLEGGYKGWEPDGTLPADPDTRNHFLYESILSGDLDPMNVDSDFTIVDYDDNWYDGTRDDNARTVVTVLGLTFRTRLDGFYIEGGRDDLGGTGGAMDITDSAIVIVNCTFRYNSQGEPAIGLEQGASGKGGAVAISGGQNVPGRDGFTRFIDCVFHDNVASSGGAAAVLNDENDPDTTQVEFVNCLFHDNRALTLTGGFNESEGTGGAIFVIDEANVEIINCTVTNNRGQ